MIIKSEKRSASSKYTMLGIAGISMNCLANKSASSRWKNDSNNDTLHLRGRLPVEDELEVEGVDLDALSKMASKLPRTLQSSLARITGRIHLDNTPALKKWF